MSVPLGPHAAQSALVMSALLAALTAGCSPHMARSAYGPRQLLGSGTVADESAISRALAATVALPSQPRLAVVLLDGDVGADPLDAAARQQVLEELRATLDRPPIAAVSIIPTVTAPLAETDNGVPVLTNLRAAAAQQRADVLVLATVAADEYRGVNALAMTYFAVLPMFVIPGSNVAASASSEACAVDVRTGSILGCRSGYGESADAFVTFFGVDDAAREVTTDAARQALNGLPAALRSTIEAAVPSGDAAAYATY